MVIGFCWTVGNHFTDITSIAFASHFVYISLSLHYFYMCIHMYCIRLCFDFVVLVGREDSANGLYMILLPCYYYSCIGVFVCGYMRLSVIIISCVLLWCVMVLTGACPVCVVELHIPTTLRANRQYPVPHFHYFAHIATCKPQVYTSCVVIFCYLKV